MNQEPVHSGGDLYYFFRHAPQNTVSEMIEEWYDNSVPRKVRLYVS